MTHLAKTLITLTALLGAAAAVAGSTDQIRQGDRLRDGSCLDLVADDGTSACVYLADQDRDRDRDQLMLKDGTCTDDPAADLGAQARVRTQTEDAGQTGGGGGRGH